MKLVVMTALVGVATLTGAADAQEPIAPLAYDLRIDGTTHNLTRIVGLEVDTEGRILVAQPEDHRYVVFDRRGERLGALGRSGEGPGEFRALTIYRGWRGSAFWQYDPTTRRVSTFELPDRLVGTSRIPTAELSRVEGRPSGINLLLPSIVGVLESGEMLAWSPFQPVRPQRGWAAGLPADEGSVLMLLNGRGAVERVLAAWPPLYAGCMQSVNRRMRPVPHCQSWHWTISPHARHVGFVELMPRGRNAAVRVLSLRPSGDTAYATTLPVALVPITRADADSIRRHRIAGATGEELKRDWQEIRLPTHFATVLSVVAADDGSTWLHLRTGRNEWVWREVTPRGEIGRLVRLPSGVKLDVVTSSHLYGIETDEDGLQSVVRFRR